MNTSLKEKRRALEDDLQEQISDFSVQAKSVGKQALVIAGGVFVAYQLVKLMTGKKKEKKGKARVYHQIAVEGKDTSGTEKIIIQEAPSHSSSNSFLNELKAEFGAMILGLVKSKIYEALENMNRNMNQTDDEDKEDSYS